MTALLYQEGQDEPWATGAARLFTDFDSGKSLLPMVVRCRFADDPSEELALLDTGAAWSVVDRSVLETAGLGVDEEGAPVTIVSRHGRHQGRVTSAPVTLLADAQSGDDLEVTARLVLMDEWPGPTVLGFHGFLEVVRLAVDPGTRPDEALLFFGSCG